MSIKLARTTVYGRSGRLCERCGMRRATNWHHRRAAGRVWTPENGLDLCGSGTTGCHGFVTEHAEIGRQYGWVVRAEWNPLLVPVLVWHTWCYLLPDGGKVEIRRPVGLPDPALAFPDMGGPRGRGEEPRGPLAT